VNTDLDTLLTALYVELDDGIIPSRRHRSGPGHPLEVTDAESCNKKQGWLHRGRPYQSPIGMITRSCP
jgi:hypothetical protein